MWNKLQLWRPLFIGVVGFATGISMITVVDSFAIQMGFVVLAGLWLSLLFSDQCRRLDEYLRYINTKYTFQKYKLLRVSWCHRGVAIAIWGTEAKRSFYHMGYRWYHILPNGAPMVFITKRFWRSII